MPAAKLPVSIAWRLRLTIAYHAEKALRASEEKYRISEEKYRTVLNVGVIGYYEVDLKGNFIYCNESILANIGYSSEELIGKSFSAATTKDQKHEIMAIFADVYLGKVPLGLITIIHPRRDGDIIYADHYISYNEKRRRGNYRFSLRGDCGHRSNSCRRSPS